MALREYEIEIGGVTHTVQLTPEDAERYKATPRQPESKASTPANKQQTPSNK